MKPVGVPGLKAGCKYLVGWFFLRHPCGEAVKGSGEGGGLFCPRHFGKYHKVLGRLRARGYTDTEPKRRTIRRQLTGK